MACAALGVFARIRISRNHTHKARRAAQKAASASESGGSLTKPLAQIHHDGSGGAPDVMALIAERIEFACCALPLASLALAIRGVQQERKRDLEDLATSCGSGTSENPSVRRPTTGQDRKAGSRLIRVEKTGDRNEARRDFRFPLWSRATPVSTREGSFSSSRPPGKLT